MADNKQGPSLTQPAPRILVMVAIGMILFIAVVTIAKLLIEEEPAAITPDGSRPSVTNLTLPDAASAKCQVPNVEVLRAQDLAFEGTATLIDDQTVTLDVSRWFKGEHTRFATVEAASPQMALVLSGVEFEVDKRYLVSASEGRVTLCGFSAPYNRELADLFEQAYAS